MVRHPFFCFPISTALLGDLDRQIEIPFGIDFGDVGVLLAQRNLRRFETVFLANLGRPAMADLEWTPVGHLRRLFGRYLFAFSIP